jgi:hypothetical protein
MIKDLKENENRFLDHHGLPYFLMTGVSKVREIYEASQNRANEQQDLIRSFSVEQTGK